MIVLVVTATTRQSWFRVASEHVSRWLADATVVPVWADGRVAARVATPGLRPQRLAIEHLRYSDLVLGLGARSAAWASLPWLLDQLDDGAAAGPIVVIDDTVHLAGDVKSLLASSEGADAIARVAHVDHDSGLAWGGYLPGFLGLPQGTSVPLLGWWRRRAVDLATDPATDDALPLEALWRDLPAAAVRPVNDAGWRLSWSTAGELPVGGDDADPTVDGEPLQLVDLAGLDPRRPWWFAPDGREPTLRASDSPPLRALLRRAAREVRGAGWRGEADQRTDALPGVEVSLAMRRWYRGLLADGDEGPPPNPYEPGEAAAFVGLLRGPGDPDGTGISRYADLVFSERPDVAAAFPAVRWSDRDRAIDWLWLHGIADGVTSTALLPDRHKPTPPAVEVHAGELPFGVNLIGYLDADLGLGVAARLMLAALQAVGVPVATTSYDRTVSRRDSGEPRPTAALDAPYRFNLLLITPDQLPFFVADVGGEFMAAHHNIGLWYWETDVMTYQERLGFDWVDEVWGSTRYLCDVFGSYDRVPVHHVPVPLVFERPDLTEGSRRDLGLDDRFTVLFSFDFLSVAERKNPFGLVEAFRRAFPSPDDGARLILKSINGPRAPHDFERLAHDIGDRADIELWDRYLSADERLGLVAAADCYASLHRSEGLGLTMAEAMAFGTPVVATAYSGNLDFMDDRSALLVPAREIVIGPGHTYPADGHWADPDLAVAADHLRRLKDDPDLGVRLAANARASVERFGLMDVGAIAEQRLQDLAVGSSRRRFARTTGR